MPQQFTSIRVNGDPLNGATLTAGIIETVIITDDDNTLEPDASDTSGGNQFEIDGVGFTSTAYPGDVGTGVEIYTATVNGQPVQFGYLTSALDGVDDNVNRLVILQGTINPGDAITNITLSNAGNTNITFGDIPSIVCFTKGTKITTPTGATRIEELSIGDLIITADNGLRAIRWIGKKHISGARMYANPNLRPITIKKDALGPGRPRKDLSVSPQHRILLTSKQAELMFGSKEVLVPAKALVNDKTIIVDYDVTSTEYIHILFDKHELVLADGLWSESFQPSVASINSVEDTAREELFEIFPELKVGKINFGPSIRQSLSVTEARALY